MKNQKMAEAHALSCRGRVRAEEQDREPGYGSRTRQRRNGVGDGHGVSVKNGVYGKCVREWVSG